jgi:hypothetical protein
MLKYIVIGILLIGSGSPIGWAKSPSQGAGSNVIESAKQGEKMQSTAKTAPQAVESFVGIGGSCHVDSRVNAYLRVYINGVYRGTMCPYGDIYPFVGDLPGQTTLLEAYSTCGRYRYVRYVSGNCSDFHWTLVP